MPPRPAAAASSSSVAAAVLLLCCIHAQAAGSTPAADIQGGPGPRGVSSRTLLQTKQGDCTAIPGCARGRCLTTRDASGSTTSTCPTCTSKYLSSAGRQNCVCPRGTFESCSDTGGCTCEDCGAGFYCPGGNLRARNNAPASERGQRFSCYLSQLASSASTTAEVQQRGLTTRSTRASRHTDCVTMPGFVLSDSSKDGQNATACSGATFSPGGIRAMTCRKCQSGMELAADWPEDSPQRSTSICRVPAGKFMRGSSVASCPLGLYRAGQALPSDRTAVCSRCPVGLTTAGVGSTDKSSCTYGLSGYQLSSSVAQTMLSSSSPTEPPLCPFGTYFGGGAIGADGSTCVACPYGTTTQQQGSTSVVQCQVPPGYFIKGDGLAKCPQNVANTGYFRSGWASYADASVREPASGTGTTACTACGTGILSELTESDQNNGGADSTSKVAASMASCYILAGQGIVADAAGTMRAMSCPANTVGAPGAAGDKVFLLGAVSAPCRPCPWNTVSPPSSTSIDACVVSAGFGYSDAGVVTQCPMGQYSSGGSARPACVECPPGRTTTSDNPSTEQASIDNCFVLPGYGLYFSGQTNPWVPPAGTTLADSTVPDDSAAGIIVLECPERMYSTGATVTSVNAFCQACPAGTTTSSPGSTSASDCNTCLAGYEPAANGGTECTACGFGFYRSASSPDTCTACPSLDFTFTNSFGEAVTITSAGITLRTGSTFESACVLQAAQMMLDDASISPALDDAPGWLNRESATTASTCIAACNSAKLCFAEFTYTSATQGSCKNLMLSPTPAVTGSPSSGLQLYVKLMPSAAVAALSRRHHNVTAGRAKSASSGLYAAADISAWSSEVDSISIVRLGVELSGSAAGWLTKTVEECQDLCDSLGTCWGFAYRTGSCRLRGGGSRSDVRTFVAAPVPTTTCNPYVQSCTVEEPPTSAGQQCTSKVSAPAGDNAEFAADCYYHRPGDLCEGSCTGGAVGIDPVATCGNDGQWTIITPARCTVIDWERPYTLLMTDAMCFGSTGEILPMARTFVDAQELPACVEKCRELLSESGTGNFPFAVSLGTAWDYQSLECTCSPRLSCVYGGAMPPEYGFKFFVVTRPPPW